MSVPPLNKTQKQEALFLLRTLGYQQLEENLDRDYPSIAGLTSIIAYVEFYGAFYDSDKQSKVITFRFGSTVRSLSTLRSNYICKSKNQRTASINRREAIKKKCYVIVAVDHVAVEDTDTAKVQGKYEVEQKLATACQKITNTIVAGKLLICNNSKFDLSHDIITRLPSLVSGCFVMCCGGT